MNINQDQQKKPQFIMDEGDRTIGQIYTRRDALKLFGATAGAFLLAACGADGNNATSDLAAIEQINASLPVGCVVRPALTEGPVFVDNDLNRSDIRTDPSNGKVSAGALLDLTFRLSTVANAACTPLQGVQVDVWHCDVDGIYSDTNELGMDTVGQKFLRGFQKTDANGQVKFTTIYPGWYEGRAVHIHFKIRTDDGYDFTSQLFFDDALTDAVFAQPPYNQRGERLLRNGDDGIFLESGEQMMLAVNETEGGYAATFDVALEI